jgi:hypothetical protein
MDLYYVNICKHEHEKNITRLWCNIVPKTGLEHIEGNETTYSYLYPFGDLVIYINSVSLFVRLSEWTEPHFFQNETPFLHSSKIHEEVFAVLRCTNTHTLVFFCLSMTGVLGGGGGRGW